MSLPEEDYFRPLRPLDEPADVRRYLAIDRYKEMFKKFTDTFKDPEIWSTRGHLIVVTGDRGFGKTSLIQRCAHWLESQSQDHCKVVVLDLSDERWSEDESAEVRIKRVFGRVTSKLGKHVPQKQISELKSYGDLTDSFHYLGQMLTDRRTSANKPAPPIALVILLPSYSKPAEVANYCDLACRSTFIFAEVFDPNDIRTIELEIPTRSRPKTGVYHLATSLLKSGDAKLLVDWIRDAEPDRPELTEEIIKERFDSIIASKGISMSELTRLTWGVLRCATDDTAEKVTTTHFAQYYEDHIFRGRSN